MKLLQGIVVSNKMKNTVVVEIENSKIHPLYKKILKRTARIKAHYEAFPINTGDEVLIKQTRPLSKQKHYIVEKVLSHDKKEKK
jgi:small subunit ribosomal protein S17